ncbi:MAG: NAD(P)-dependent oxidoreductase [Armatimonadota bacterium]
MTRIPVTPKSDLDLILAHTEGLWEELRGRRVFISGGTGFFGRWILESLARANDVLDLNTSAVVLTRDPRAFARRAPDVAANGCLEFLSGDVRDFSFPQGEFACVVHGAADSGSQPGAESQAQLFETIVHGTRRVLDLAVTARATKFLLISSGAVYGPQAVGVSHVPETCPGGPDPMDPRCAYAEGKRAAEMMCGLGARRHGLEVKVARCFAFVGPHLPLDAHFAIGNFIRDGLRGGPIQVNGDGSPLRSYLYAADLMIWLWTILFRGEPGVAYNVGSEDSRKISEWASLVARSFIPVPEVLVAKPPARDRGGSYVPQTLRARSALGLRQFVGPEVAIAKTIRAHQQADEMRKGERAI